MLNSLQSSLNSNSQGRAAQETLDHLLSILEQSKKIFDYSKVIAGKEETEQLNMLE